MHTRQHPSWVTNHYLQIEGFSGLVELTKWAKIGAANPKGTVHTRKGSIRMASGQRDIAEHPFTANNSPDGRVEGEFREWNKLNEPRACMVFVTDDVDDPEDPNSIKRIIDLGQCQLGDLFTVPEGGRDSPTVSVIEGEILPEKYETIQGESFV